MRIAVLLNGLLFATASHAFASDVVINEIMYNNPGTDVEFVELINTSNSAIDLQGWYILDDNDAHLHCPLAGILQPGAYLVIAANIALFQSKYPAVSNLNPADFDTGINAWGLGNGGDAVRLFDPSSNLHDIVVYGSGGDWPASPDGGGPSLELLRPSLDNALPASWDPSSVADGTPGQVNSVFTQNVVPTAKDGERLISLPGSFEPVPVTVIAYDAEGLNTVDLFVDVGNGYEPQLMFDDGTNGDQTAGDSVYAAMISPQPGGTLVRYYAVATDDIGQKDYWPDAAPAEYRAYTVDFVPPKLRVTEILAANNAVNSDDAGQFDDWLEIRNEDAAPVNLGGMFVSDALDSPRGFQLPALMLQPGEYVLVWADNEPEQGLLHADFRLAAESGEVAIFETIDHGNVLIHGWKYPRMATNISMGYKPDDGSAPEFLASPSPGASNDASELFSPVCINEFQATSNFGGPDDWVEIYNRSNQSYDISGAFLSDERLNDTKWTFPQGTIIQPGTFLVIFEDALGFGFASEGSDVIVLTAADSVTSLDFYDFGPQTPDLSEGRFPDGVGSWTFFASPTRGMANTTTSVNQDGPVNPGIFSLDQNYPNPFNPSTTIRYTLPDRVNVRLVIYTLLGAKVREIVNRVEAPGIHSVDWDGRNEVGRDIPSGLYFYKLIAGSYTATRKLLLVR
jgi:hypothetical protein